MIDEWGGSLLPSCHNWSIVNGWKNSSSAFFTTRSTSLFRAKHLMRWKSRRKKGKEIIVARWRENIRTFTSLSLSLSPFLPIFQYFLIKLIKRLIKRPRFQPFTSPVRSSLLLRPFVIQRNEEKERKAQDIFRISLRIDSIHGQTLTYVQKWNFIKVTWKRPNVGGNRVPFRVCRKFGGEEASEFTLQKWQGILADDLDDCPTTNPGELARTNLEFAQRRQRRNSPPRENVTDSNFFPTCDKPPQFSFQFFLLLDKLRYPVALGIRVKGIPCRTVIGVHAHPFNA